MFRRASRIALRCVDDGVLAATYIPGGIEFMCAELAMFELNELGEELVALSKRHGVKILKSADEGWQ